MTKSKDINDPVSVTAFIKRLDPAFGKLIQAIRKLILETDPSIGEQIKWNSPSFFYTGEMKPFDPKEYKRDMIVMNVRKNQVLLVFPTGAVIKDKTGIMEGDYQDGRRLVTFRDQADLKSKGKALQLVIREWLKQVDR